MVDVDRETIQPWWRAILAHHDFSIVPRHLWGQYSARVRVREPLAMRIFGNVVTTCINKLPGGADSRLRMALDFDDAEFKEFVWDVLCDVLAEMGTVNAN